MSTKRNYTVSITLREGRQPIVLTASTHKQIADVINGAVGWPLVSRAVIVNWLCRKNKSPKYDFISITN